LFAKWAPESERSRIVSIALSGVPFGTVLTNMLSGYLAVEYGWSSIFYIFGLTGIVWCLVWLIVVRRSPEHDRWISEKERNYIMENTSQNTQKLVTPWKMIFLSIPVWAITIVHTSFNWGFYTLLTYLPDYLKSESRFNIL
jgi:MFS family permease